MSCAGSHRYTIILTARKELLRRLLAQNLEQAVSEAARPRKKNTALKEQGQVYLPVEGDDE